MSTLTRKYRISPERIGRHHDIAPFVVVIEDANDDDAQVLAEGLHSHAKQYLLSKEFSVNVDLARHEFTVTGGRHGKGSVTMTEEFVVEEETADA